MTGTLRPIQTIALFVLAHLLSLSANSTFPALLPEFQAAWALSGAEAGWINGIYYAGYVAAVPLLVTLTDRVDARIIYLGSAALGGLAALGFAVLAEGLAWALVFRLLGGIGLAGTYMVGLRLLTDCLSGPWQSRGIAWYTASFALGVAISVFLAGELAQLGGWRLAHAVAGLLTFGAAASIALAPHGAAKAATPKGSLFDLRPALGNRRALAYNIGYGLHVWELFGWRAWLVAYLVFLMASRGEASFLGLSPTQAASLLLLLGMPASVLGNEAALRFGRRRTVSLLMLLSGGAILCIGLGSGWPLWALALLLMVHAILAMADSAALTSGAVLAAAPERKGATMAVHSLLGFGTGMLAPLAFGLALDWGGGGDSRFAWALAFGLLAAAPLLAPWVLYWLARPAENYVAED